MNTIANLICTAAAVVIAAGTASAQNLHANVPFSFTVSSQPMAAGYYTVAREVSHGGAVMFRLSDAKARHNAMVRSESAKPDGSAAPRLLFECGSNGCALAGIAASGDGMARTVQVPRNARDTEARRVAVLLTSGSAR
jgi:hypothetical protein